MYTKHEQKDMITSLPAENHSDMHTKVLVPLSNYIMTKLVKYDVMLYYFVE